MPIIAICNPKGGTGKTTSAINIAYGLASLDYTVLLIDLDPQAGLTYSLGLTERGISCNAYHLLKGINSLNEIILHINGVAVVPAGFNLAALELEFAGKNNREMLLKEALRGITGFNYVIIDCPPGTGMLTLNALTAATEIYAPVTAEHLAGMSIPILVQIIKTVDKYINPSLSLKGIMITRYHSKRALNSEVLDMLDKMYPGLLMNTLIRENTALAEAPGSSQDIFRFKPRSTGARDYIQICHDIIRRSNNYTDPKP